MKKFLYIVPGWEDSAYSAQYIEIDKIAKKKAYTTVMVNIDWSRPLSEQLIKPEEGSVLIGFSLGAVYVWLMAQSTSCKKLILASMTPVETFFDTQKTAELAEVTGIEFANDIAKHISKELLTESKIIMYGDQEGEIVADIFVKDTEHELTPEYIRQIDSLI